MQQFTTRRNGYREVRNKLLIAIIPVPVIVICLLIYFAVTSGTDADNSWLFTLVLFTPVMCYSTYQTLKRQKRMFESFRLTITEDAFIREQHNTPTITIPKSSIREITRTPGGILCIFGESKLNAIGIPAQIENADDLERALSEIKPVIIKSNWTPQVFLQLGVLLLVMAGSSLGLLSEDRIIVTISGVALCAFLVYGFILIHRSKNIDNRMKRMRYIGIIPVLSILGWMALQWLGE